MKPQHDADEPKGKQSFSLLPKRIIIQSLIIQLFLFLPFISFFVMLGLGIHPEPSYGGGLAELTAAEKWTILHFWFALFFSSAFFSCLGSLMSYMSRNRDISNDIKSNSFVLSLHIVGSIFGIIMFLLFLGGFVAGTLFPSFDNAGYLSIYLQFSDVQGWAKLFVWTFIAGFSERLMPDLLSNIAKRISPKSDD